MSIKLTKNELRSQQTRLTQFNRYLPTLQLKKAMLQFEVSLSISEIEKLTEEFLGIRQEVEKFAPFLTLKVDLNLKQHADILHVKKSYENIAGVEIPIFEKVLFRPVDYFLFDTPPWTERASEILRNLNMPNFQSFLANRLKNSQSIHFGSINLTSLKK